MKFTEHDNKVFELIKTGDKIDLDVMVGEIIYNYEFSEKFLQIYGRLSYRMRSLMRIALYNGTIYQVEDMVKRSLYGSAVYIDMIEYCLYNNNFKISVDMDYLESLNLNRHVAVKVLNLCNWGIDLTPVIKSSDTVKSAHELMTAMLQNVDISKIREETTWVQMNTKRTKLKEEYYYTLLKKRYGARKAKELLCM